MPKGHLCNRPARASSGRRAMKAVQCTARKSLVLFIDRMVTNCLIIFCTKWIITDYLPPCKHFSSAISTRIISSPTWRTQFHGMRYSLSFQKLHNLPAPGTISECTIPFFTSTSMSMGYPRDLQLHILITSFCFSSQNRIRSPPFPPAINVCRQ